MKPSSRKPPAGITPSRSASCVLQCNAGCGPTASIPVVRAPSHQVYTSRVVTLCLFPPPYSDLYRSTFSHTALFMLDCSRESHGCPKPSVCALPASLPGALALSPGTAATWADACLDNTLRAARLKVPTCPSIISS